MQSEVAAYMKEKKGWPERFCSYYAERFWNHYQSNGWKVSGRAAMKDWKAAFNSQWQNLKFSEDVAMLTKCRANDGTINGVEKRGDVLNNWLNEYKRNWDKIPDEVLAKMYDYMKPLGVIKITEEQREIARKKPTIIVGKAYVVKTVFDEMITYGRQFKSISAPEGPNGTLSR